MRKVRGITRSGAPHAYFFQADRGWLDWEGEMKKTIQTIIRLGLTTVMLIFIWRGNKFVLYLHITILTIGLEIFGIAFEKLLEILKNELD